MAIMPGGPGRGGPQLAGLLGPQRPRPGQMPPQGGGGGPMPGGGPGGPGGGGGSLPPQLMAALQQGGGPGGPGGGQMPGPPEVGPGPQPNLQNLQRLLGPGGPAGPGAQNARPGSPDGMFKLNEQEESALSIALNEPRARQQLARQAKKLLGLDMGEEDDEDEDELGNMPGPSGRRDAERMNGAINGFGTGFDTDNY